MATSFTTLGILPAALGPGAGSAPAYVLTAAKAVHIWADSQGAGRGTGTGTVNMDGARALSWPTKLRDKLITLGYSASSESFGEAANTGGNLALYDPRVTLGGFGATTSGNGPGGYLLNSSATATLTFAPGVPADTFVFLTLRDPSVSGGIDLSIDGGAVTTVSETGSAAFVKQTLTTTLGTHILSMARNATGTNISFIQAAIAYNSAAIEFRVYNWSARGWTTSDFLVADKPYRVFPAMASLVSSGDIVAISLGGNDVLQGFTPAANRGYLLNLIDRAIALGAYPVIVVQMPIRIADETTLTQVQMRATMVQAVADYSIPIYRGDIALGSWEAANAANQVVDNAHWKAPASATYGNDLGPIMVAAAQKADTVPLGSTPPVIITTGFSIGSVFSLTTPGVFSRSPTIRTYQWQADGVSISGATGTSYTSITGDEGKFITVLETAANAAGPSPALRSNGFGLAYAAGTTFLSDNFDSAGTNVDISARASSGGQTWSVLAGEIDGNAGKAFGKTTNSRYIIPNTGAIGNADYSVNADFLFKSALSTFVMARVTDVSNNIFAGYQGSQGGWVIGKVVAGTTTNAIGGAVAYTPAANDAHTVELRVVGTTVTLYIDSVSIKSVTIADAVLQTGRPGLNVAQSGSTTTGVQYDNFTVVAR